MTIILLSIIVLICAGVFIMLLRGAYDVNRIRYGAQAYFLAEAGVEEAIKKMNEEGFSPSGYPKSNQPLGSGTYSVSIRTNTTDASRKLITSTGTVKSVSRTIYVQVYNTTPAAFDYAALGVGKLTVSGGSVVSDTTAVTVHSNSPASNDALTVGSKHDGSGLIEGNGSACGGITVYPNGSVTGSTLPNSSYVAPPPFDDSFFHYYYNLAFADHKTYSGNKTFTGDPLAGTANHVVYVDGQAILEGSWTMTGCVVATQKIIINKTSGGHITQHQYQNLPAFMSRKDVEIYGPTDIEGLVYADGWIDVNATGVTTIYGSLYGTNWVNLESETRLHYRRPNPPGLPSGTVAVTVLSWSE